MNYFAAAVPFLQLLLMRARINLLHVLGRSLRIFFALFWFLWTGIIIPAHARGAIPVAGSVCCHCGGENQNSKTPINRSPMNCAVCQLAAHLMPAITIPLVLQPGERLELAKLPPMQRPICVEQILYLFTRGPPSTI